MYNSIKYLPRSGCICLRHKKNKDTNPIMYWTSTLSLLSLVESINNDIYQQQKIIRAAKKVAKTLVNDTRAKIDMNGTTQD
jgi:hypothetical protein